MIRVPKLALFLNKKFLDPLLPIIHDIHQYTSGKRLLATEITEDAEKWKMPDMLTKETIHAATQSEM
jgi:hypothetical protein